MKYSKGKQAKRGGGRSPDTGVYRKPGEGVAPVKTGTANFGKAARKVDPLNRATVMRGGIRL